MCLSWKSVDPTLCSGCNHPFALDSRNVLMFRHMKKGQKECTSSHQALSAFVYLLHGRRHGRARVNLQPLCANVRTRRRLIIHHLLLRRCKSKCVSPWKQPSSLHQGVLGSVSVPSPALDLRSSRSLTPLFNGSDNFINALTWEWFGLVIGPHKSVMWKIAANQSVVLWTTLSTVLLNINFFVLFVCLASEL